MMTGHENTAVAWCRVNQSKEVNSDSKCMYTLQ